ncbi:putative protein family UPF0646 [Akanthomyces lecanii RCEF 1005]|uniref:Glutamic acid-rich protein n=1 Tax=Akanthomyces lecanii RCEF 1005 TaxID=1081108 RepID=A0A168GBE4_CORDF|nr:putative protein family UPF0646 [Akanthomyces lecanii RCEF 1005]
MDVDTIQQPSLEVPVDDDLINYESDAADYSLTVDQDLVDGAIPESVQNAYANAEHTDQSGNTNAEKAAEDHSMDNLAEAAGVAIEYNANEQPNIEQAPEPELPLNADAAGAALDALTEAVGDEIDYGLGEVDYSGEQNDDGTHEEVAEEAQGATENAGTKVSEEHAEISWEDDAADNVTAEVQEERVDEQDELFKEANTAQFGDWNEQANVEDDEKESRDRRQDEWQALESVISGNASIDAAGDLQLENTDRRFPNITVQYQGDEFPFFSSGNEGFFSDLSILNDNMQNVFSGFRSQLEHEVTAEDELVFQVDELGLEFTESTPSNVTMHQILEVFDLLIKNDDPNGRRTLYTYLFTRLNSARRYEFLVESATSGKGLEEIQHHFSQQSIHNDSDGDGTDDSAVSSEHAEDQDEQSYAHEQLDEDGENDEHDDVHHEEYAELNIEEHGEVHIEEHAERDVEEHGEEYHEEPADDHQEEVEYFDESVPQEDEASHGDDSAIAIADPAEGVDANEHDDSFAHEHSSTTSTLQGDADGTALADDETAVDAEADGPVFVTEANEDAEIDWRDDDEIELVGDGGSVTGKRSRDDNDEPDVDDEIDFKRRRS